MHLYFYGFRTCQSPCFVLTTMSLSLKWQHLIQPMRKPIQQNQGQAQGWALSLQHSLDKIPGHLVHSASWTPLPVHQPMLTTARRCREGKGPSQLIPPCSPATLPDPRAGTVSLWCSKRESTQVPSPPVTEWGMRTRKLNSTTQASWPGADTASPKPRFLTPPSLGSSGWAHHFQPCRHTDPRPSTHRKSTPASRFIFSATRQQQRWRQQIL